MNSKLAVFGILIASVTGVILKFAGKPAHKKTFGEKSADLVEDMLKSTSKYLRNMDIQKSWKRMFKFSH